MTPGMRYFWIKSKTTGLVGIVGEGERYGVTLWAIVGSDLWVPKKIVLQRYDLLGEALPPEPLP